jgi:hypothetical protein
VRSNNFARRLPAQSRSVESCTGANLLGDDERGTHHMQMGPPYPVSCRHEER